MKDLPNNVCIHKSKFHDAEVWCRNNLGPRWEALGNRSGIWCCFWAGTRDMIHYNFYFLKEEDALIFRLKWL